MRRRDDPILVGLLVILLISSPRKSSKLSGRGPSGMTTGLFSTGWGETCTKLAGEEATG